MKKEIPIQIEIGEWWHKGCFIQEQNHPNLQRYRVFKDDEDQTHISTHDEFWKAVLCCEINEVKDYVLGAESFK